MSPERESDIVGEHSITDYAGMHPELGSDEAIPTILERDLREAQADPQVQERLKHAAIWSASVHLNVL